MVAIRAICLFLSIECFPFLVSVSIFDLKISMTLNMLNTIRMFRFQPFQQLFHTPLPPRLYNHLIFTYTKKQYEALTGQRHHIQINFINFSIKNTQLIQQTRVTFFYIYFYLCYAFSPIISEITELDMLLKQ